MASRMEGNTSVIEPLGNSGVEGNHLTDNLQSTSQRNNDSENGNNNGSSNNLLDSSGVVSTGTGSGKWNVTSNNQELSRQWPPFPQNSLNIQFPSNILRPSTSSSGNHSAPNRIEQAVGYINSKSALEFLPKSNDGQNIPVSKFVRDCLFARDSIQPKERPLLLRMIRSRLCGDADLHLQDQEINSLDELLNDLKAAFSPHENVQDLTAMLSTVGQKNDESAENYGVRVRKILKKLVTAIEHENDPVIAYGMIHSARTSAVVNFVRGLKKDLEIKVSIKNPKPLQEATSFAKAAECEVGYQEGPRRETASAEDKGASSDKNDHKQKSQVRGRFIRYRGRRIWAFGTARGGSRGRGSSSRGRGAGRGNGKRVDTAGKNGNNILACYACGETRHLARGCLKKRSENTFQCYACGKPGHVARDCKEKQAQVTCYACGVEGHISTKCPKQQEDKGNMKFGKSSKEKEQEKSLN